MFRASTRRDGRGGSVLWILVCALALPFPKGGKAQAGTSCEAGAWRLEGASSSPEEDGSAVYVAEWEPLLDEVAACLAAPALQYACIEIQGQFDDRTFSSSVVTAFGSLEAAQQARARARANVVQARLEEKGVSPGRLRQRSPGREPTFRGATLTVVPDCLPRPVEMSDEDRKAIAEARAILANPPTRVVEVVREVPRSSGLDLPLHLEAGLQGGMGVVGAMPRFRRSSTWGSASRWGEPTPGWRDGSPRKGRRRGAAERGSGSRGEWRCSRGSTSGSSLACTGRAWGFSNPGSNERSRSGWKVGNASWRWASGEGSASASPSFPWAT